MYKCIITYVIDRTQYRAEYYNPHIAQLFIEQCQRNAWRIVSVETFDRNTRTFVKY